MDEQADFRNLRVLLVGGKPAGTQVLRTAFGLLGLRRLETVAESARAIEAMRSQVFSAIFCDAAAERYKNMTFPVAARRTPGIANPMTPLFIVYSHAYQHQVEQARDIGVTDVLTHPVSAATIARKLAAALLTPRPFIAAADFFGPDRRTNRQASYYGDERRTRAPRKIKVAMPQVTGDLERT